MIEGSYSSPPYHSQIAEKEKWQRYCWELEERLHEATNASHVKEVRELPFLIT
jgi:hypothetical protein